MTLAIILICCLPAGLILLVIFAIGSAGGRTFRVGKRAYADFKPYINDLKQKASRAEKLAGGFAGRAEGLTKTYEEISGRWAFIIETISETTNSPAVRIAEMAGRFTSRRGR